jgi:hypothetical protein
MYMNINSVDEEMQSVIEAYRFQIRSNAKTSSTPSIKEKAAFDILIDHQNRSKTTLKLLEIVAGEMLKKRSPHSFV